MPLLLAFRVLTVLWSFDIHPTGYDLAVYLMAGFMVIVGALLLASLVEPVPPLHMILYPVSVEPSCSGVCQGAIRI